MASNQNNENPDPFSRESGGPAHNTTLDVLDGRLPGADQTSNMGQRLRGPGEQLPEGGPRNRETSQDTDDQLWVARGPRPSSGSASEHGRTATNLSTLDKAVVECLSALGFGDMRRRQRGCCCCRSLKKSTKLCRSSSRLKGLDKLLQHCTSPSWRMAQRKYNAIRGGARAAPAAQRHAGRTSRSPGTPVHHPPRGSTGLAALRAWRPPGVVSAVVWAGWDDSGIWRREPLRTASCSWWPFNRHNNFSSNPTALGAEGAGQRAGFCSTAPTDASQGASSAVRSTSQPVGAESQRLAASFRWWPFINQQHFIQSHSTWC